MEPQTTNLHQPPLASAHTGWMAILSALAGVAPEAFWGPMPEQEWYQLREDLKAVAGRGCSQYRTPMAACFRAPYWLMHAYSHWLRAHENMTRWDAAEYDEVFPQGMDFRRYLGAWLWSVGIQQLGMTVPDVEAIHAATGVGPLPHLNLPMRLSYFQHEPLWASKAEEIPAARYTLEELVKAVQASTLDA